MRASIVILVAALLVIAQATSISEFLKRDGEPNDPPGFVLATTFTKFDNDSIVLLHPEDVSYVLKSKIADAAYDSWAFNSKVRSMILIGISGAEAYFDFFNADALKNTGQVYLKSETVPADMQYDGVSNQLYGIDSPASSTNVFKTKDRKRRTLTRAANGDGFVIAQYDIKKGTHTTVMEFPDDVVAVDEYSNGYDEVNHRYFVAAVVNNKTAFAQVYVFNLQTKQVEKKLPVPDFIQNTCFDPIGQQIVGIYNFSYYATLSVESGKLTVYDKQLDFSSVGFRELSAGTCDPESGKYYALFENEHAVTKMIVIDMRHLTGKIIPFYNHIDVMKFIPLRKKP